MFDSRVIGVGESVFLGPESRRAPLVFYFFTSGTVSTLILTTWLLFRKNQISCFLCKKSLFRVGTRVIGDGESVFLGPESRRTPLVFYFFDVLSRFKIISS